MTQGKWPKDRPILTDKQQEIFKDWYEFWLSESGMPGKFSIIDQWGHKFTAKRSKPNTKILEIGAGTGSHLNFEKSNVLDYYALEHNKDLSNQITKSFPNVHTIEGDCQQKFPFPDAFFDRIIAIHVLEHLDNLTYTLEEVQRTLQNNGIFTVVIPCEGGFAYKAGRQFTSKRLFQKRYKTDYEWLINYDHINNAKEVIEELDRFFIIEKTSYFPSIIKSLEINLVIGLICKPRKL